MFVQFGGPVHAKRRAMADVARLLAPWASFYVIIGSSAAALTGLVFVVITLVAGVRARVADEGIAAFTTPTVVHFASALFVALAMSAPWTAFGPLRALLVAFAAAGLAYVAAVGALMARQRAYTPGGDDWTWYVAVPALAYAIVVAGGAALTAAGGWGPYAVAGGTVLLVFLGIRNAWDVVTYLAIRHVRGGNGDDSGR